MHIVHGPKGGTSVPKAVGHCVRMRTRACRMRGTSLGAKTTGQMDWCFFGVVVVIFSPPPFFFFLLDTLFFYTQTILSTSLVGKKPPDMF